MGFALAYGFIVGDFWKDGGELMDNPWGIVSLFDVYVGFFFFIGWIAYRESCPKRESFWLGLLPSAWAEMWLPVFMRLSLCLKAGVMLLFSFWEKRTKLKQANTE